VLERAAILCEGGLITTEHLALYSPRPTTSPSTTDLGILERQMIEKVLLETRWNKVMAAKRLGLSRTQLYGRLRKYDLDRPAAR
jgi:transcriptional regulator of acetoin/glycerol metabolism